MNGEKLEKAIKMMMTTDRMHKRVFDKRLADIGMHRSSHVILLNIHRSGGIPSQKRLAEILGISPAAVTGALKRLEAGGYITRNNAQDTRYNEVMLTDLGRQTLEAAKNMFSSVDRELFYGFSEEELDTYIECLNKMQNNIERMKKEEEMK